MSRTEERSGFPQSVRTRLLETDVDDLHSMMARIESSINQTRSILMGMLVSIVLLCLGIVANVVLLHH